MLLSLRSLVLTSSVLLGAASISRAQETAVLVAKNPPKIEYLDAHHQKLPSEAGAVERVETTYRDTVSGASRSFFLPSGKLKSYTPYAIVRKHLRHGTSSEYYESGQLRRQATYVAGKCVGDFVTYYPDGTLKRRDQHAPDQPITGECFGPDGKAVPYYSYEQMPVYSEGTGDKEAMVRAVMQHARYPVAALRSGVYGKVKIRFVVDRTGQVQQVRPEELAANAVPKNLLEPYAALQEAAMQAVRQLKSFKPGMQDGEPVSVDFTVPVTFNISASSKR